jgi:endonuclease III
MAAYVRLIRRGPSGKWIVEEELTEHGRVIVMPKRPECGRKAGCWSRARCSNSRHHGVPSAL